MKIAVVKESEVGERRVALIPETIARLVKQGWEIWVESGAGEQAYFNDRSYSEVGATIINDTEYIWHEADVILKVGVPQHHEIDRLKSGAVLISFLNPLVNGDVVRHLAHKGVTALAMELIPRSTRAQSMDALSSQASIAGYKAALLGASALPKYFPMLTTAAGTIRPAKVFVIGAGVAGLQAIATARRLGAMVEAFDIRPAVKEEVQSLGAKFIEVPLEEDTVADNGYAKEVSQSAKERSQQAILDHVRTADVVITTANVPGKIAPILVTADMVTQMKPGSVIVDIAAEQGGNCELTQGGKDIQTDGITIMGPINLPSSVPVHASQLLAKNISTLLQYLIKDQAFNFDFTDEIVSSTCVTHQGEICHPRVKSLWHQPTSVGVN